MRGSLLEEIQCGGKEVNSTPTPCTAAYVTQHMHCTNENTEALPLLCRLGELITSEGYDAWEHTTYRSDALK